ncbi:MAG: hypothetical protein JW807_07825 [Spirochaetes bacterium]|nr:hypothetical protein [Spirochaetota bacterium]
MKIETTIRISKNILEQLNNASILLKQSRTYLIRLLLKMHIENNKKLKIFLSTVKYQHRDKSIKWHTFHLTLREDEYELCLDLRKIHKMSLSFIVADAVRTYLPKLIEQFSDDNFTENADNYLYKNYIFFWQITNGIQNCTIYWGFPGADILKRTMSQNTV